MTLAQVQEIANILNGADFTGLEACLIAQKEKKLNVRDVTKGSPLYQCQHSKYKFSSECDEDGRRIHYETVKVLASGCYAICKEG